MTRFIKILPTLNRVQFLDTQLEGYQVRLWQSFNLFLNRWMLNIENQTLGLASYGIIMNQGTDMLNQSGKLDLQALVLTNNSGVIGTEADADQLGNDFILLYMDLETYNEIVLEGALVGRSVYRVA